MQTGRAINILAKIRRHGFVASGRLGIGMIWRKIRTFYYHWRFRHAPHYVNPTSEEYVEIERDLRKLGISISDYEAESDKFKQFLADQWFPEEYHGGRSSSMG